MTDQKVTDRGDLRKYRTEIPNLIDDLGLSVYAFRLYVHLKRVAGESGTCYQSTDTMAAACKMSKGMISKAKTELVNNNLISITEEALERGGRAAHHITINDIWLENFIKYSGRKQDASSQSEQPSSPDELASSPHEIKKEPLIKKEPIKNKGMRRAASNPPREHDPEKAQRNREVEQIAHVLAAVTGMDYVKNIAALKKEAKYYTLSDIPVLTADYSLGGAWYQHDWRGKRGEKPGLYTIRQTFKNIQPANGNGAQKQSVFDALEEMKAKLAVGGQL